MDMNLYFVEWLVRERMAEAHAAAARGAWLYTRPRRPARVALGQALIRLGRRLQGDRPSAPRLATGTPVAS